MTEGLMLALLASLLLTGIGWKTRSLPILFIAALGWLIGALDVYTQTEEVLPMALLLMIGFSNVALAPKERI